jgi:orotidine-5'-phosphate decarboxylase
MKRKPELIVALDVDTLDEAKNLVKLLGDLVSIYKVGSQLFTAYGPAAIQAVLAPGKKVFLDLKFHDIPNTVANAVTSAVGLSNNGGIMMCTVHTLGGVEMLKKSVDAAHNKAKSLGIQRPYIVGITVLTSDTNVDNMADIVLQRAQWAKEAGLDGVVASSLEAQLIRKKFGEDFIIVTPGIRPKGAEAGDQKRVTTPLEAISNGSNFLVVGRPIVAASNPRQATEQILNEIKQAQN